MRMTATHGRAAATNLFGRGVRLVACCWAAGVAATPGGAAPAVETNPSEPKVYRTMMPDAGPSALAIELPGGLGLCYDVGRGGIAYAWRGPFVDLDPTWKAKINQPAAVRGEIFYREEFADGLSFDVGAQPRVYRFKGYRYLPGAVELSYILNGILVREAISAVADGSGVIRHFRLSAPVDAWGFKVALNPTAKVSSPEASWDPARQAWLGQRVTEFQVRLDFNPTGRR